MHRAAGGERVERPGHLPEQVERAAHLEAARRAQQAGERRPVDVAHAQPRAGPAWPAAMRRDEVRVRVRRRRRALPDELLAHPRPPARRAP